MSEHLRVRTIPLLMDPLEMKQSRRLNGTVSPYFMGLLSLVAPGLVLADLGDSIVAIPVDALNPDDLGA